MMGAMTDTYVNVPDPDDERTGRYCEFHAFPAGTDVQCERCPAIAVPCYSGCGRDAVVPEFGPAYCEQCRHETTARVVAYRYRIQSCDHASSVVRYDDDGAYRECAECGRFL
jgi:hypothetical protein